MAQSIAAATRNLISSERYYSPRRRASTSDALILLLAELIRAFEACTVVDFEPAQCLDALIPYYAPVGMQYGDAVPEETPTDMYHTKLSGAAITALACIVRKLSAPSFRLPILGKLRECWTTLCMGLLLYARVLYRKGEPAPATENESPGHTFTAIVTVLQIYAGEESLLALVRNTPEALNLIFNLWVFEIKHPHLSTQLAEMFPESFKPTATVLLLVTRKDPADHGPKLVEALASDQRGSAFVPLEHMRRSILSIYQYGEIPADAMHAHLFHLTALHTTAAHHLLLQDSVRIVTEALMAVTSQPFDSATAQGTTRCIRRMCAYLCKYVAGGGLVSLNQSLEAGLLVGLLKAHPWLKSQSSTALYEEAAALLTVHLPPYLIYISVLRQARQPIHLIQEYILKNNIEESFLEKWRIFETHVHATSKLAIGNEFVEPTCECTIHRAVLRCSTCWEAAYCSQQCQIVAWNAHRLPCAKKQAARQAGILPDLSSEDTHFALRVAQNDFEKHKVAVCEKWLESGTLPLVAGIDYTVFPPVVSTNSQDIPAEVKTRMASDAAIYTVFPTGSSGRECYMCDLGLTHAPGEPDGETIKVVVQVVKAQRVPAFLRID
ncbi:hypothetical protein FB45DRAFT_885608 [Roridomyces roridus]|uniref:MYND-type domain-containing protein n=1 Tax=Roridomyces roridus TaxID=1738132 RepID=A0AAD7CK61_9AGAR|nr:hypothetical protein FB45DRAFT_885608 [Roridomyces roridus]